METISFHMTRMTFSWECVRITFLRQFTQSNIVEPKFGEMCTGGKAKKDGEVVQQPQVAMNAFMLGM